jgi:hypothetical protein
VGQAGAALRVKEVLKASGTTPPVRPSEHAAARCRRRTRRVYLLLLERLEDRTLLAARALKGALGEGPPVADLFEPAQLHVLKAKKTPKPAISAAVTAGPSASGSVTVAGKTYPKAKANLAIGTSGSIAQGTVPNRRDRRLRWLDTCEALPHEPDAPARVPTSPCGRAGKPSLARRVSMLRGPRRTRHTVNSPRRTLGRSPYDPSSLP